MVPVIEIRLDHRTRYTSRLGQFAFGSIAQIADTLSPMTALPERFAVAEKMRKMGSRLVMQ